MSDEDKQTPGQAGQSVDDIESYLRQREALEAAFEEKFHQTLTVMFTDLKGSTTIAEKHGDLVSRQVMQHHNDILFPVVKEFHGTLVKTIGDGTLSYFEHAQDALRAAVKIQKGIDHLNRSGKFPMPVLIRIGIHTGKCILEKNDIFGDTVNTASRFESSGNPGEIQFSEETFNALENKGEIYSRFDRKITLKGKSEPASVYKAFWSEEEIEIDRKGKDESKVTSKEEFGKPWVKYVIGFGVLLALVLLLAMRESIMGASGPERRSINHSVTVPPSGR